jgi:hypothetical protein
MRRSKSPSSSRPTRSSAEAVASILAREHHSPRVEIKLKAAFAGLTWLPSWIALATSNLSPHLILEEDGIDYKVTRSGKRRYDEIATVDFRKAWGTRNIFIRFTTGSMTFTGNVVSDAEARRGLAGLRDKGCFLSSRAKAFVDQA